MDWREYMAGTTARRAGRLLPGQRLCHRNDHPQFGSPGQTDIEPVNSAAILERVAGLPIPQWRFQTEASGVKHIGPMAQDFHAAFGLGADETAIATVDADGVALAAIQGLNQKLEQKETEITELKHGWKRSSD